MEEKYGLLKKRRFAVLIVFALVCTLLLSGVVSSISIGSYIHGSDAVKKNIPSLPEMFQCHRIIKSIMNNRENEKGFLNGLLNVVIHTKCDGVEKSTEVSFGIFNDIDVDDDENTGVNGFDISVQYLLLPWIEFEPDLAIGLLFTISVERIGEEIKDKDFSVTMELGENNICIGYGSPVDTENEIPKLARASFIFFFNPFDRTHGFRIMLDPKYDGGIEDKKITLFAEYNEEEMQRSFSFEFDPAIETQITLKSTKKQGQWQYQFNRISTYDSTVTASFTKMQNDDKKETIFVINQLPEKLSFLLELTPLAEGGGQLIYESSKMYDTELLVTTDELGVCRYATFRNTPKKIVAEWVPTLLNGSYAVTVESEGTDFILKDSLTNPIINFTVSNLESIDISASWNLSNPGDFTVNKNAELDVNLEFKIGEWIANLNTKPTADYILVGWQIDESGYLEIDTNWEPFNTINLLIKGEELGMRTNATTFKANDFCLNWTLSPLHIDYIPGSIFFLSIDIDVYLLGRWWNVLPPW